MLCCMDFETPCNFQYIFRRLSMKFRSATSWCWISCWVSCAPTSSFQPVSRSSDSCAAWTSSPRLSWGSSFCNHATSGSTTSYRRSLLTMVSDRWCLLDLLTIIGNDIMSQLDVFSLSSHQQDDRSQQGSSIRHNYAIPSDLFRRWSIIVDRSW